MKQKTVMMEYFEYAEHQGVVFTDDFKNYYLEKEKEQMLSAFEESRLTHPMIGFKHETFIDYFNETYKSDNTPLGKTWENEDDEHWNKFIDK